MSQAQTTTLTLGANAIGSIDPAKRIPAEITYDELDDFVDELQSGLFHSKSSGVLPRCCVDGRHRADGECILAPNAAGGVFTLLAADMLTNESLRQGATNTAGYAANLFKRLDDVGYKGLYGDHNADKHGDNACGCGAIDNLPKVIEFIANSGQTLFKMSRHLGFEVNEDDHQLIISRAQQIAKAHKLQMVSGEELMAVLLGEGKECVETLTGGHNEVAVVVNQIEATTLNRAFIAQNYGDKLEAFNYDHWAIPQAVATISTGETDERQKLAAADYYNLAVTCVLAGPGLRVVNRI